MATDLTAATVIEIADFYQPTPSTWFRANMVISSDGHFLDSNGSSRGLSSPLDLKVLLTLRAISDAVFVGAQTVRAEDYRPPVLAGDYLALNDKAPRLVVLSKSLSFDLDTRLFSNESNPPIIVTETSSDPKWIANRKSLSTRSEIWEFAAPINLADVIDALNKKGLSKIVCEGGPDLLAQLITKNLVDELDITRSPVSVGTLATSNSIHQAIDGWTLIDRAKLAQHEVIRLKR